MNFLRLFKVGVSKGDKEEAGLRGFDRKCKVFTRSNFHKLHGKDKITKLF